MTQFSFAAVFSDHCVLQRDRNITIFGYADDGLRIKVTLCDSAGKILAENCGKSRGARWEVRLDPQAAQTGCSLTAECADSPAKGARITLNDVAVGEVWLAGGQSNMEFELHNCEEGPAELADADGGKNVRFYYTNKIAWKDDKFFEAERNTCWQTWESQWKTAWSAVGYFFAKKLAADLGVTVGVIGCNWGGTSASAWMRREYLEKDIELKTYLDEQTEATAGKSIEQQCAEYDAYEAENDIWQKKCAELYETVPGITWAEIEKRLGKCPWPGPKSCKNPYRPTGLYECMVSRIIPYTLRGVIWYQGESDDHKPHSYRKLFTNMIDNWRTDFQDDCLPFIFVQLPAHRYEQDKDFRHWCFIREAQQKVHDTVKNAWMTCALDLGQYNDIHPKAKKTVAERMENTALATVYGKISGEKALPPMLKDTLIKGSAVILTFANASDGFETRTDQKTLSEYKAMEENQGNKFPENFTGFEIAGDDGVYYPAQFELGGKDAPGKITLTSGNVPEPKSARYAWYNYGPATVFGKNGLPLAPFRTAADSEQTATESAAIQQIMTV